MKHFSFLVLCCYFMIGCNVKTSTTKNCDSDRFNQLLLKYFSPCLAEDSLIYLASDTYRTSWYFLKDDGLYSFGNRYCPTYWQNLSDWQSNAVVLYKKTRLLWFQGLDETDTHQYVFSRFLLCDTCGEVLDSIYIKTYDGGAVYDYAFDHEYSSAFYVDRKNIVWLYYKDDYKDTMTCTKTVYEITETKIKQCGVQEYKLTDLDYSKGWQGWR